MCSHGAGLPWVEEPLDIRLPGWIRFVHGEVMMNLYPHESEDGFSLVELVIALLIIALAVLGGEIYYFKGEQNACCARY